MATRRASQETAATVFERMRSDHRAVLQRTATMLADAEAVASGSKRRVAAESALRAAVAHLARQFATHMRAEDEVIYPAVERTLPSNGERLLPLRADHEELRSMLSDLRRTLNRTATAARDEQVAVRTQDLVDLLRIHIRKEEAIVFTLAEQLIPPDRLRAVVERLRSRTPTARPRARAKPGPKAQSKLKLQSPGTSPRPNRATKSARARRAGMKPKGRTR